MHFRTRIFAISILTVTAVLTLVISLSWSRIMAVELTNLDARLCMEAKRLIPKHTLPDVNNASANISNISDTSLSGRSLMTDLTDKLRVSSPNQLMLSVGFVGQGLLTAPDGVNVQDVINHVNWESVKPLTLTNNANLVCQFGFFNHQQNRWRASLFRSSNQQSFIAVDVAATTSQLTDTLQAALIMVIPFSLLLSILGAWFIATNTIKPINRLHKAMDKVTQKDLSHRLPEHKEDKEFKMLIDAYNMMLDRLEDSFKQVSRFTADAAHELKTPLTVLRGKLEQAVLSENPSQLDLNAILDEVGHLSAITRKLLLLSQADSGSMALHFESINITKLIDESIADMNLLSDELTLDCVVEKDLMTQCDFVLLRQLLNNLLVNVMRYSLPHKTVTIHAHYNESVIEVLMSNACLPMAEDVRAQLFDRFYRGEPAHTQGISGSGLGLSLAREIARAHGGDLTLEPSDSEVVTMRLLLPIVK